jgi:hypothetical protein
MVPRVKIYHLNTPFLVANLTAGEGLDAVQAVFLPVDLWA